MEWSDISSTVAKYAPLAAEALSSPLGAAVSAGTLIANLFGVDDNPESVLSYINENPDKAQEKLNTLQIIQEQNRHQEVMTNMSVQTILGAQQNSVNINRSPVDNAIKIRLVNSEIIVLFFSVASIISAIFYGKHVDSGLLAMLGMVIGFVIKSLSEKDGFYWGTSFGSQKKDDIIAGKK